MAVRTFQIGTRRKAKEGLRLGTVRFLPRGVKKKDYSRLNQFDVWLPVLAPSSGLVRWAKGGDWGARMRKAFYARYAREMEANTDARQVIQLVAQLGRRTSLSVGCYCADEKRCHRSVLIKLIRKAQKAGK